MNFKYINYVYLFLFLALTFLLFSCGNITGNDKHNEHPTAYVGEDRIVKLDEKINFSGYGTDNDGFITLYQWDLDGDGKFDKEFDYATTFTYSYNKAGIYKVTLKVTDDKGATAEDSCVIKAGCPYPKEGEENWNTNEDPVLDISNVESSTIFKYKDKYYMLILTSPSPPEISYHYAKSNDGINWTEIDHSEFPCTIPSDATSSTDIEIKYIDKEFIMTFSSAGYLYLEKSQNGTDWTGGIISPAILGSSPTYVINTNYECIWFTRGDKIYLSEKSINNTTWPDPNSSILDNVDSCHVIFDGKTYFMWYTDKDKHKIYLIYSTDPLFQQQIKSLVIDINNLTFDNTLLNSIIFSYNSYKYILYLKAYINSNPKIYISTCSNFASN